MVILGGGCPFSPVYIREPGGRPALRAILLNDLGIGSYPPIPQDLTLV